MKKKTILFIFLVAVLLFTASFGVSAGIIAEGTCGDHLTWTLEKDYLLTITGSGGMDDYEKFSDAPWFPHWSAIQRITVKEGVTHIGGNAFVQCYNLMTVSLPASVQSIGDHAFKDCEYLKVILIPGKETTFGEGIFAGKVNPFIVGEKDGTAEAYAKANGYAFLTYFKDVMNAADYYFVPVIWAKNARVVEGIDEQHFAPEKACTRAEFLTILHRFAGEPEPENMTTSFEDVPKDSYYCKAVLWAAEKGVTSGTSATTFSPDKICTRAEVLTLICRAAIAIEPGAGGSFMDPDYDYGYPFNDVKKDDWFYRPVVWAVGSGIARGTSERTFSPYQPCTRNQVVTFLFRSRMAMSLD